MNNNTTLPTQPGLYASAAEFADDSYNLYALNLDGSPEDGWQDDTREAWLPSDKALIPCDLVRLVPVAEAEELRRRIEKAREHLIRNWDHGKTLPVIALLDGEATDV